MQVGSGCAADNGYRHGDLNRWCQERTSSDSRVHQRVHQKN